MKIEKLELEDLVNQTDYKSLYKDTYPSVFAISFVNFIKLVNDGKGEENKTPPIHYDMLDQIPEHKYNLYVAARGTAKTSVIHEYLTLYIGTYGGLPIKGYESVDVGMYVADTMDNGVKSLRKNVQFRYENSMFLQKYIPEANFTEGRIELINAEGSHYCLRMFGVTSGVRGFKEYGKRPVICGLDDLLSDKNANSPTVLNDIEEVITGAARQALHPSKRMMLWTGTPFNKKDPLYKAAGTSAWNTRVYPVCEKFPCERDEFVGAWEDRFSFDMVREEYTSLSSAGRIDMFNRELMLRLISDDDRLVALSDMPEFSRDMVLANKERYNFYITTDFAVSDKTTADNSVILVWAYTTNGDWLLVDGVTEKQLMDKNVEDLFRFVLDYRPLEVGVEISGQQKGFISWLYSEMVRRNIYFTFASDKNSREAGIRPATNKFVRFNTVVPLFKSKKIWLPKELKEDKLIIYFLEEVLYVTDSGIKSRTDDVIDNVSQLPLLKAWKPSEEQFGIPDSSGVYAEDMDEDDDNKASTLNSYIV